MSNVEREQNLFVNKRLVNETMFATISQVAPEFQIRVEVEANPGEEYKTPPEFIGETFFGLKERGKFRVPENHRFISLKHTQPDLSNFWRQVDEVHSQSK